MLKQSLFALFEIVAVGAAEAHDCYTTLVNPVSEVPCCDDRDCRPVVLGEIEWKDGHWYFNGAIVPPTDIIETHACDHPAVCLNKARDEVTCLIIPLGV